MVKNTSTSNPFKRGINQDATVGQGPLSPKKKDEGQVTNAEKEQTDDDSRGSACIGNGYPYEELPTSTSIRLLEFGPIRNGKPRTARMRVVDLNDHPEYTALSYTWGQRNPTTTCICDGHEVRITQNLGAFLQRYRGDGAPPVMWYEYGTKKSRTGWHVDGTSVFEAYMERYSRARLPGWKAALDDPFRLDDAIEILRSWPPLPAAPCSIWIDSVCINQSDPLEVDKQVALMGDIYRDAACVNVWLGESEEHKIVPALRALTILAGIYWPIKHMDASVKMISEEWSLLLEQIRPTVESTFTTSLTPHRLRRKDIDWHDLEELIAILDRPWFHRAWTYQESKLATRRIFSLGDYNFDTNHLYVGLCGLQNYLPLIRLEIQAKMTSIRNESDLDERTKHAPSMHEHVASYAKTVLLDARTTQTVVYTAIHMLQNWSHLTCCRIYTISHPELTKSSLLDLLISRRGPQCTVQSDLVYSLLGLAKDGKVVVPDSDRTWQEVFTQTVAHQMQTENCSRIPIAASNQLEVVGLPSWVPDWRVLERSFSMPAARHEICPVWFRQNMDMNMTSDIRRSRLRGYVEDVVKKISSSRVGSHAALSKIFNIDESRWKDFVYITSLDMFNETHTRPFYTNSGFLGKGGSTVQPGDEIAVIWGSCRPVVLRKKEEGQPPTYRFIGQCYIHSEWKGQHPPGPPEFHAAHEPVVPQGRREQIFVIE